MVRCRASFLTVLKQLINQSPMLLTLRRSPPLALRVSGSVGNRGTNGALSALCKVDEAFPSLSRRLWPRQGYLVLLGPR
jgi:hypothetical protein